MDGSDGFVAVRGAGKICGFPPTERCCCFELRTGLIIFPSFLVVDLFVVDVLFWLEAEKNVQVIENENNMLTPAQLQRLGAFHFLVSFLLIVCGLVGTIRYRSALVKPLYLFSPASAMFSLIYAVVQIAVTTGLTKLEIYWALLDGIFSAAIDLWYGYCMWSLYWQLRAGIICKPNESRGNVLSTSRTYQGAPTYSALNSAPPLDETLSADPSFQAPQNPRVSFQNQNASQPYQKEEQEKV